PPDVRPPPRDRARPGRPPGEPAEVRNGRDPGGAHGDGRRGVAAARGRAPRHDPRRPHPDGGGRGAVRLDPRARRDALAERRDHRLHGRHDAPAARHDPEPRLESSPPGRRSVDTGGVMQGLAGTLVRLRAAYAQDRDQGNVNRTLKGAVYAAFAPLRGTVDDDAPQGLFARAVEFAFYRQSRANDGVAHVTAANRERCLVTLLAAHGNAFQLAVHVYVGLMEGITPEELADLVFLA